MNPKVRIVVEFMKLNLHHLTLSEIAKSAGLSNSRVESLFKGELGKSPMQYHKELRLEKACELLEDPSLAIKHVRLEVGYQDHSHFFRDFKKHFGMTPSQYRERHTMAMPSRDGQTKKTIKSATKQ